MDKLETEFGRERSGSRGKEREPIDAEAKDLRTLYAAKEYYLDSERHLSYAGHAYNCLLVADAILEKLNPIIRLPGSPEINRARVLELVTLHIFKDIPEESVAPGLAQAERFLPLGRARGLMEQEAQSAEERLARLAIELTPALFYGRQAQARFQEKSTIRAGPKSKLKFGRRCRWPESRTRPAISRSGHSRK